MTYSEEALQSIAKEAIGKSVTLDFHPPAIGKVLTTQVKDGKVFAELDIEGEKVQAIIAGRANG